MKGQEEKKLNKEQKQAVEYGKGPLLIIAGAGTGKTTVVTERIKHLISSGKAQPKEILALTFTDKAAREMEERVDVALPYGYTDMWISTFHSFGDRVLRQEALEIGLDPRYRLMTGAETTQFLIKNLFKFDLKYFRPLGNPTKFVDGMLQHFSRLKDEDVSPEDYLKFVKKLKAGEETEKALELAKAYQAYEELKVKQGLMDFSDLISYTLTLFRRRQSVLAHYQKQFKHLLVDEFQDTNYAQYALLKVLAPPKKKPNLTVVGDDSQSIYKFRGAAVSNILQFMKEYPRAKQVILTQNYRSTQTILDHAYRLIKNNDPDTLEVKLGISKNLKAMRSVKEVPLKFIYADRVENEAEMVAKKIRSLTDGTIAKYRFQEIAILVRANNHAEPFARALGRAGIPYQFLGPGQLFRQPEVKDLIAYLKVLYNFEDNVALYRVLSLPLFEIFPRDLAAINNYARRLNFSLFEALEQVDKIFVGQTTKEKIKNLVTMIYRHLKLISKETAGQILYYFLEESGLLKKLTEYKTISEEREAQNISQFFDRLRTYEVDHEDASVPAVVDWLNLSLELGESPLASNTDWVEEDKVNLLTVHSAKGLEFPVVFLVNLVEARFPTRERQEQIPIPEALIKEILPAGDYHRQEERRLFYVGMTRAADRLYLTAANYYGEGKREKKISQFVFEALGKQIVNRPNLFASEQLSILDWQSPVRPKTDVQKRPILPINYLSYSQIATYETCPLQYRYRYLQRIPIPSSATQSFGEAIHKTLHDFGQEIKMREKPSKKDLLKFLEKNWSSQGYANRTHEQRMKKRGEQILVDFYQKFDWKTRVKELELPFVIKINPSLKIGGKIDRIDENQRKLEIIDYKTGRVMAQKDLDSSLQMTLYALAAADKGIYRKKAEEIILTFYFLDAGEKKSTFRSEAELKKAKKTLIAKAKEIEQSSFNAKPGTMCDFCDYRLLCEAWR
jgi:DNA helicase-2/ATP-dependent DNA helicase PcrA